MTEIENKNKQLEDQENQEIKTDYYELPVNLSGFSFDDDDLPKWNMVALSGEYRGYRGGSQPFTFTKKTFDSMVMNIRNHPNYKAGADGIGINPVIPWDFEHASSSASSSSVAVAGMPAQGWTYDLKVKRKKDGRYELWALTEFLEPAKTYIKTGKYRWASVTMNFDHVDPISNANLGPTLLSIALTNSPVIQGMEQIAASQTLVYDNKEQSVIDNGIDNETKQIAERTANQEAEKMSEQFKISLSESLGVSVADDDIMAAVKTGVSLRSEIVSELELSQNANTSIVSAIKELKNDRKKLTALCETLEAKDDKEAIVKLGELLKDSKELEEMKPQLEELRKEKEVRLAKEIDADVNRVVAQNGWGDNMKTALTMLRKEDPERFAVDFPVLPEESKKVFASKADDKKEVSAKLAPKTIDISGYEGSNIYFKAIEYCKANVPRFVDLSWEAQMDHVRNLRKEGAIKEG
jgi:phage I-like protein